MSKLLGVISLVACMVAACKCNRDRPDVSNIHVKLNVLRFENDMTSLNKNYDSAYHQLDMRYGDFMPFYLKMIARVVSTTDTNIQRDTFLHFINDPYIQQTLDTVNAQYHDISDITQQLTQAFRYFRFYFPNQPLPRIITYIDGPPYGFTFDTLNLCIGLDGYLGPTFPAYTQQSDPVPAFALRKFRREYIVPNTVSVWCGGLYDFNPTGHKLLDAMVYHGKLLYATKKLLPDTPDSLILSYPDSTITWLNRNEHEVWHFFVRQNLLYESDPLEYSKYVNDAPNTSGMPPQAPGNIGSWLGYRIVEKYMSRYPNLSLPQLMREPDAQRILTESRYKP